jgi:hypothetical protein
VDVSYSRNGSGPQRDWLGHTVQFFGLLAVFGIPVLAWAFVMGSSDAKQELRLDRLDKDVTEARQMQTIVSNQMIDINRQLATIAERVGNIRDEAAGKRR